MWSLQPPCIHPPPTSLPYAEELASPLALCGGLGVMTERSHSHSVPREMENNRYSAFKVKSSYLLVRWRRKSIKSQNKYTFSLNGYHPSEVFNQVEITETFKGDFPELLKIMLNVKTINELQWAVTSCRNLSGLNKLIKKQKITTNKKKPNRNSSEGELVVNASCYSWKPTMSLYKYSI